MPKFLRIVLSGSAFLAFFLASGFLGRIALPVLKILPGTPERKRMRRERLLLWAYRLFTRYLNLLRLVEFQPPPLPPELPPSGQAYVVIANHPSLIDVMILLAMFPGLTSVAKVSWYRSWLLRPLLELGGHIPGPQQALGTGEEAEQTGAGGTFDSADSANPVLDRMVEHLRAGNPLVIFPEGSRSHERSLRRFRRGAVEAAIRAGVPIVPVFISMAPPMLMKHQPWHEVPAERGRFTAEFFPIIPTAGRDLDARALNQEIRERYEQRHAQMLRARDALAAGADKPALPPGS